MKISALKPRLEEYAAHLYREERSRSTVTQYRRDIAGFFEWAGEAEDAKETVILYKQKLMEECKASSANVKLAALNGFLNYVNRKDLTVRLLRVQKKAFCPKERELTKAEYARLVRAARQRNDERLTLLLETICSTGIRVSELKFITVEALRQGEAVIHLKGKDRTILLPGKLRKLLRDYARRRGIRSGAVFVTRGGKPIDRSNIWKAMKGLCKSAGVDPRKVFPHNLRHLFARCFYAEDKDIAKLADILGHSSINTTRIYILSTGAEHRRRMDALGLVI